MYGILFAAMILLVVGLASASTKEEQTQTKAYTEMRCPSCGAPVRICGDSWECTWCSDFGRIAKE